MKRSVRNLVLLVGAYTFAFTVTLQALQVVAFAGHKGETNCSARKQQTGVSKTRQKDDNDVGCPGHIDI